MRLLLSLLFFAGYFQQLDAQVSARFREIIDSTLSLESDLIFEDLRPSVRPIRRDSAALVYFRDQAALKKNCTAEGYANDLLGKWHRNQSNFEEALAFHWEAERVARYCVDTALIATAFNGIGVVHRRQDNVTEAIDAHTTALEIAERVKNPDKGLLYALGVALNSLGNIYLTLEQWEEAEREFVRSMLIQDSLGNDLGVAINNQNLGYVAKERGQLDKALAYFKASELTNKAIENDFGLVLNYVAIADLYGITGRAEEGYKLMQEALPLALQIGDEYHISYANIVMSSILLELGKLNEAENRLKEGLMIADLQGIESNQVRGYQHLATIDSLRGNYLASLKHLQLSQKIEGELLSDKNRRYVGGLSAKLTTQRQLVEIERLAQENALVRERSQRDRILFVGIIAGVVFLLGLLYVLYRQRRIIEMRDMAHLEQQRLSSQMNPHFLFNALNSIKAFLIDNERDSAISYLDTFAQLVRRILQSSIDETVSLREELQNCQLYVRIENARLNNEVDFVLEIDPTVDQDEVVIPPLLLQPFLENAFWHGLQSKEGVKELDLTVRNSSSKSGVEISIRDNGIGRKAAEKAKAHRVRRRQSVGIDITRKRLGYYAKQEGKTASFETHDLQTPEGNSLGTEVVINIG